MELHISTINTCELSPTQMAAAAATSPLLVFKDSLTTTRWLAAAAVIVVVVVVVQTRNKQTHRRTLNSRVLQLVTPSQCEAACFLQEIERSLG
jgi:drug/metabolite transporter (DMT)-like permease